MTEPDGDLSNQKHRLPPIRCSQRREAVVKLAFPQDKLKIILRNRSFGKIPVTVVLNAHWHLADV